MHPFQNVLYKLSCSRTSHHSLYTSPQSLPRETRKHKASAVDRLVVISAQVVFLLLAPRAQRLLEIAVLVLAAHHEADLAGWVCRYCCVRVLDVGEDFEAGLLEVGDQRQVKPLVLSYLRDQSAGGFQRKDLVQSYFTRRKQMRGGKGTDNLAW